MAYKTPGVYIKEVTVFPPSVAQVATAIPAFIGYTERAERNGEDLTNVPTKISSILDFTDLFGFGPSLQTASVTFNAANQPTDVTFTPRYYLFDCIQMFFANGGGDCYIVSVGGYNNAGTVSNGNVATATPGFLVGLNALEQYDEPTMILAPDAVLLANNSFYSLQQAILAQCVKLQDRFGIFDLLRRRTGNANFSWQDSVQEFRDRIGINGLRYGAAYTPYLYADVPFEFIYGNNAGGARNLTINIPGPATQTLPAFLQNAPLALNLEETVVDIAAVNAFINDPLSTGDTLIEGYENIVTTGTAGITDRITYLQSIGQALIALQNALSNNEVTNAIGLLTDVGSDFEQLIVTLKQYDQDYYDDAQASTPIGVFVDANFTAFALALGAVVVSPIADAIYSNPDGTPGADQNIRETNARNSLQTLFDGLNSLANKFLEASNEVAKNYQNILRQTNSTFDILISAIEREASLQPPSAAMAGIYTAVDDLRGVHKAPANVSVSSVSGPSVMIDDNIQEDLNVDVNAGKSINAIRAFTGKGTLVWGARTLAGNDNEWRYVSVRRFFNTVEESIKKSTGWAVFEPNDASTWSLIRSMINNYLYDKWQEGALQGATPDEAYFVHIGEGLTFTPAEKLAGIMRVKIGMAVVRPAEFIILEFSHKMVGV